MKIHKWLWFDNNQQLNSILANQYIKKIVIHKYNITLKYYLKAIMLPELIFPIIVAFNKNDIKNINTIQATNNYFVYTFSLNNSIHVNNTDNSSNIENMHLFSEYLKNIIKVINILNFTFIICHTKIKNFQLEFYMQHNNTSLNIIIKLIILRIWIEETALNRGLMATNIALKQPIKCIINNNLFKYMH